MNCCHGKMRRSGLILRNSHWAKTTEFCFLVFEMENYKLQIMQIVSAYAQNVYLIITASYAIIPSAVLFVGQKMLVSYSGSRPVSVGDSCQHALTKLVFTMVPHMLFPLHQADEVL